MAKKDYTNWDRNDLIKEIDTLRKRKKYGLVWEEKPEDVVEQCKKELPVLEEAKDKEVITDSTKPFNLLIEGDNYHALSVLNYTHKGKIDVIYIDPPYNTGASDWKYNNDFVDAEDPYRHTKWISFMSHRLRLAKQVLAPNGIICVTVDDYEFPRLTMLMEDIFGEEHRLGTIVIRNNPQGRSTIKGFSVNHEYALFYGNSDKSQVGRLARSEKQLERYPEEDENGDSFLWENFRKTGSDSLRVNRPKQFYPLYISGDQIRLPKMDWNESKKAWDITESPEKNDIELWPIDDLKNERVWKWGFERVIAYPNHLKVKRSKAGKIEIYRKNYPSEGSLPNTFWGKPRYAAGSHGTNLLTKIFGKSHVFDFPKSVFAVQDCIQVCSSNKNAIILDCFAGSGTTGQAVLELNKNDGGNRKFILCTNNENGIAEKVCFKRLKHVINGYAYSGTEKTTIFEEILTEKMLLNIDSVFDEIVRIKDENKERFDTIEFKIEDNFIRLFGVRKSKGKKEGLGGNLKYFKTSFVSAELTDKNRVELTRQATEMLCVKEATFELVEQNADYKIFKNKNKYTGIIFDHQTIDSFKEKISKLNGKFKVYIFSLGDDTFDQEFEDIREKVTLSPIPEAILRVYSRIFK